MAQGSKSKKDNEKAETSDAKEAAATEAVENAEESESTEDAPVVIEGEAEEVQAESESAGEADTEEPAEKTTEAEPISATVPAPAAAEPAPSGPGAMSLVFGGIVAGAIGFGASFLAPPPKPVIDPGLSASIDAAGERIDELAAEVSALKEAPAPAAAEPDLSGIEARIGELAGQIDTIASELSVLDNALEQTSAALEAGTEDLSQRLAALESIDPSGMPEASEDQIAAFRERLEAITADTEARLNAATQRAAELEEQAAARAEEIEAAAAARVAEMQAAAANAEEEAARIEAEARRQAALADVRAALESGTAFAPALETFDEVPEDLAVVAEKGVPTLLELQRSFPQAARAALTQAATVPEDASTGDRLAAFLKRRTGARSLTPKEGSSPDAILSRAEAALESGDLETALTEIETLPEPSQAALGDWVERARTRAGALDALDGLTATN